MPGHTIVIALNRNRASFRLQLGEVGINFMLLVYLLSLFGRPINTASASVNTVQFSTTPALYPAFDPAISDYVVRCTGSTPVQISVSNSDPSDTITMVSVDGQAPRVGTFSTQVSLNYSQGFTITVTQGVTSVDYHLRCLPSDFPIWTAQRSGSRRPNTTLLLPASVPSPQAGSLFTIRMACRSGGWPLPRTGHWTRSL